MSEARLEVEGKEAAPQWACPSAHEIGLGLARDESKEKIGWKACIWGGFSVHVLYI